MDFRRNSRQSHNVTDETSIERRRRRRIAANNGAKAANRPKTKPIVSVEAFRDDPLYPKIVRAVAVILQNGKSVAPADVLVRMDLLAPERLEDWRRGRVPYLEKVINGNLTRLSRLLRILRFHAHDLRLVPSITVYMKWGKGPKRQLRFTKTGDSKLEEAYSRHFVWPGKGPFHPPASRENRLPEREARKRDKAE